MEFLFTSYESLSLIYLSQDMGPGFGICIEGHL